MKEDQNSESVQVFISYSHDDSFHKANILSLAQELRSSGVNASIDRFVENDPPLSWPLWMQEQVEEADAVLLVFTETYTRRFVNRETLGTGLGAKWEGAVVTAHLYHSQAATSKFIPILIDGSDLQYVPAPLSLTTFYVVGTMEQREADSAYFEPLLRRLLGQPAIVPAPLTAVAKLPVAKVVQPPAQTKVDQALSKESPDDKVRALKGMLYDADNELSGLAAFNLGLIWQGEERFADSINAYHRAIELLPNSSEAAAAAANLGSVLERMNRHYGVGSAVQAALGWLRAIRDDDVKTAWRTIAPKTRLALAQAWLLANLTHPNVLIYDDRNALAQRLSQAIPEHPLSAAFLATQLSEFERAYQAFDEETWGAAERPRRFGIDLELVIFLPTGGGPMVWEPEAQLPAVQLSLQRYVGEWYIAGFSDSVLVPGWPPSNKPLDEQ